MTCINTIIIIIIIGLLVMSEEKWAVHKRDTPTTLQFQEILECLLTFNLIEYFMHIIL